MDTWSYQEITDPSLLERCIQDPSAVLGKVVLELHDGKIACAKRQAFLNLFWWPVLTKFDVPICKRHFVKRIPLTRDSTIEVWNKYYDEIMAAHPDQADAVANEFWNILQDLYLFTSTKLHEYTGTMDILDMAEMLNDDKIRPLIDSKEKVVPEMGTSAIEKFVDIKNKEIMSLVGTKGALTNESMYPYQHLGQLNKFQFPQMFLMFGVRTDISDTIISYPVKGSAVDGLRNSMEYAVESLSAKKAIVYNKVNVPSSQYLGRKQHLVASAIQHVYHGDCGSTNYVDFKVTEANCDNMVGKFIFEDGQLLVLTKDNVRKYIGTTVKMRSPMTCRYRKGVCEVCGGKVIASLSKGIGNIGIVSAIQVIEPTTQKILSAKHLIKTNSKEYVLPPMAQEVLLNSDATNIRWKPEISGQVDDLMMGVPLDAFTGQIEDVNSIRAEREIHEERFSSVKYFALRNKQGTEKSYPLMSADGRVPFFSKEMLMFLRDHFDDITTEDGMRWFSLKGTRKLPIFRAVVMNDNMQVFVRNVKNFLGSKIPNYGTCADALQAFSDIVYSKVSVNIAHIEIMLKAYEITSDADYSVPYVSDPNSVKFQNTLRILSFRNVGVELGFEGLKRYIQNPSTYLVAKGRNPFDMMIGYKDY